MAHRNVYKGRKPRERKMTRPAPESPHEPGWAPYHAATIERRLHQAHLDLLPPAEYHETCDRALGLLQRAADCGRLWATPQGRIVGPALAHIADLYGIDVREIAPIIESKTY